MVYENSWSHWQTIQRIFKCTQLNVEITGDGHESRCSAEEHSKLGQSGKVSEFLDQMW